MHRDFVSCMKLICQNNNATLTNTTKMVKLNPPILVRIYSSADIMTSMLHLKLFHAIEQGIFHKASKIHSDILNFNTSVDIARQKMSTLAYYD